MFYQQWQHRLDLLSRASEPDRPDLLCCTKADFDTLLESEFMSSETFLHLVKLTLDVGPDESD